MADAGALLVVAGALIDGDGRVLLAQRPAGKQHGGLWEFPGGKVEPGEAPEEALARELAEEIGIMVDPRAMVPAGFASEAAGGRPLVLLLFVIRRWEGAPRAIEAADIAWVSPDALGRYPMPPADVPLAQGLVRMPGVDSQG